jgi:hypothetical protein
MRVAGILTEVHRKFRVLPIAVWVCSLVLGPELAQRSSVGKLQTETSLGLLSLHNRRRTTR